MMNTNAVSEYQPGDFYIYSPSKVDWITADNSSLNSPEVILDGSHPIVLDSRSEIGTAINLGMTPEIVEDQVLNGRYFIVDGQLVDYRFKSHVSYEHDEESIKRLIDSIGFSTFSPGGDMVDDGQQSKLFTSRMTESFEFNAFGTEGGAFDVGIGFSWSPFSTDIKSFTNLVRFVCSNMMAVSDPSMSFNIPMINDWEQNLDVSNNALRHMFEKVVGPRIEQMPNERISLFDLEVIQNLVTSLLNSDRDKVKFEAKPKLHRLSDNVQHVMSLADAKGVSGSASRLIEAPVTAFDAYNIATEVNSHYLTERNDKFQQFANSLIFDSERRNKAIEADLDDMTIDNHTFEDPDAAFFGQTCH